VVVEPAGASLDMVPAPVSVVVVSDGEAGVVPNCSFWLTPVTLRWVGLPVGVVGVS
jgi:hypothetical protein